MHKQEDFPMKISTKRLNLKPLQEDDGKIIFDAIQESRACLERWLLWPRHVKTWQDSEKFAKDSYASFTQRKSVNLGIFKDEEFIGVCGFNYFAYDVPAAEIGYWCRISAQKNGYTKEAVAALVQCGFEKLRLKKQIITCLDNNRASSAIAEILGFQLETRALGLMKDPQSDDFVMCRQYGKKFDSSASIYRGEN